MVMGECISTREHPKTNPLFFSAKLNIINIISSLMPEPTKRIREGGRTYCTFHVRPYATKKEAETRAKTLLPVPLPTKFRKEDGGWWGYVLTPTDPDDFPQKMTIRGKTYDLQWTFSKNGEKARELRGILERQGQPAKVVQAVSLHGDPFHAVYARPKTKERERMAAAAKRKQRPLKNPPLAITGKWYGHKLPMQLYQKSLFETRKAAEEVKVTLREKGEVVQIKPFEGWYALYHTEGLGKTLKVEVKYASTAHLTPVEKHSAKRDGQRRALPVGKRVSKFGKVYYEYRENRGDGPAELKEKWGEEKALAWAKNARAKKTRTTVVARLVAAGGKEWRSDSGAHRVYFNDLAGLYGLKTSRYGTGNISSATLRGSGISNSQARKIESAFVFAKLWYDVGTKTFGSKGLGDDDKAVIVAAIKKKAKI